MRRLRQNRQCQQFPRSHLRLLQLLRDRRLFPRHPLPRRQVHPLQQSLPRLRPRPFDPCRQPPNPERRQLAPQPRQFQALHSRPRRDLLRPPRRGDSRVRARLYVRELRRGHCHQEIAGRCLRAIEGRCRMFRAIGPADRAQGSPCVRNTAKAGRWGVQVQTQGGHSSIAEDHCQREHAPVHVPLVDRECCLRCRTKCLQAQRQSPESHCTRARLRRASGL